MNKQKEAANSSRMYPEYILFSIANFEHSFQFVNTNLWNGCEVRLVILGLSNNRSSAGDVLVERGSPNGTVPCASSLRREGSSDNTAAREANLDVPSSSSPAVSASLRGIMLSVGSLRESDTIVDPAYSFAFGRGAL